jgi:hypothetical protein
MHVHKSMKVGTGKRVQARITLQGDALLELRGLERETLVSQIKQTNHWNRTAKRRIFFISAKSLAKHGVAWRRKSSSQLATSLHFGWRRLPARQVGES